MHAREETAGRDILGVHGRLVSVGVLEVRRGNHGRGMSRLTGANWCFTFACMGVGNRDPDSQGRKHGAGSGLLLREGEIAYVGDGPRRWLLTRLGLCYWT